MTHQTSLRHLSVLWAALIVSLSLAACSSADDSPNPATGGSSGTGGKGGGAGDAGTAGNAGNAGTAGSAGAGGKGGDAVGGAGGKGGSVGPAGDYGFTFTRPETNKVSCSGSSGAQTADAPDADWLCTFHVGGKTAYVYAQSKATGATCVMGAIPTYTVVQVQISVDGAVSNLENATYDYGGNHHNDSLSFDYQGKSYKYYHSSFGFGWRACQPMDCINEGCSSARSLPEVCVPIKPDGTHDPLVDTFRKCPGDTN